MKLSTKYLVTTFFILAIITGVSLTPLDANRAGPPIKVTGSPGDGANCTSCHTGTASTLAGLITSNIPAAGYIPGTVYTITATLTSASNSRFGFQISPQNASGTLLGTMTVTDATRTQLNSSKYIEHTSAGSSGSGGITWSFNWKAPATGSGTVTFYGAFNYANNNNADTGDAIRLSTLSVSENLTASVAYISENDEIKVWPNPVADVAHFSMPDNYGNGSIKIFNASGSLVQEMNSFSREADLNLSGLSHGIYYVSLNTDKGSYSHKFIKE